MAKRKAGRPTRRRAHAGRTRSTAVARKTGARKRVVTKAARKVSRKVTRKRPAAGRSKAASAPMRRKARAAATPSRVSAAQKRKVAVRKPQAVRKTAQAAKPARPAAPRAVAARKRSRPAPAAAPATPPVTISTPKAAAAPRRAKPPVRKIPSLDRERRTIRDEDVVQGPPSSLDLDRHASAFRSGRKGLRDRYDLHTETGPALTGGDVDADWESAYSVGDEAPGGDNPTPDQDVVDDIGRAVGVNYDDNEELKGEKKISDRDRHRWELDPASSDDYDDR